MLKRVSFYALRALFFLIFLSLVWVAGFIFFTRMIPGVPESPPTADGIVIFTGGQARLQAALKLFEKKKAPYLLISGVNPKSNLKEKIKGLPIHTNVTLGYSALDTVGNANETAAWVREHNLKSILLITSNYHLPRSLLELRAVLPNLHIETYPIVGKNFQKEKWWVHPDTLFTVIKEYHKLLFALLRRIFTSIETKEE